MFAVDSGYPGSSLAPSTLSLNPSRRQTDEPDSEHPGARRRKDGGTGKRRKVSHACLYCRRSHMTCDDSRPCQRWCAICNITDHFTINVDIRHLCHDEPKSKPSEGPISEEPVVPTSPPSAVPNNPADPQFNFPVTGTNGASTWPLVFPPEASSTEFSVLSDFLDSLEDQTFFNGGPNGFPNNNATNTVAPPMLSDGSTNFANFSGQSINPTAPFNPTGEFNQTTQIPESAPPQQQPISNPITRAPSEHIEVLPAATKTERFLLTAADQEDGTRDERLARVIHAKYEAGMLKPFNYVKGYARLLRWMERNVSPQSKQQILQPLSIVRPKFRAIAQSLTDIDLVFIEEAFERLLLNYDRVFSAMGIPACLWRRTGEIYKGNKEFADLVGVDVTQLRDGRLCIYELMSEESAVNYWEKYGHVAFDTAQKAVLTSCVLRYKPAPSSLSGASSNATPNANTKKSRKEVPLQERFINCCFSFTIQRDLHGIPTLIAGNFIQH